MSLRKKLLFLAVILAAGSALRFIAAVELDGILQLDGLYVDEVEYSRGLDALMNPPFERPPGMYVLAWLTGLPANVTQARFLFSLLSMVPAVCIFIAFGNRKWGMACAAAAALEPLTAFFGLQLLPAIPAAAILSLALLAAVRKRILFACFLAGVSMLFRGEIIILMPVLLIMSIGLRERFRRILGYSSMLLLPVLPVVLLNIVSGAGAVVSTHGAETLWLGTDWELIGTPPGVEFEALMRLDTPQMTSDQHFGSMAMEKIVSSPMEWIWMGTRKAIAAFTFPGPGRNLEVPELVRRTGLLFLIPLSVLIFSLSLARISPQRMQNFSNRLSMAMICTVAIAAFLFVPAARYRTALFPAVFFLAASSNPSRNELIRGFYIAALITLASVLIPFPGSPRKGLTEVQSAQEWLDRDRPDRALEEIRVAAERGYEGADMHNIAGAALSGVGRESEGLREFLEALATVPDSPTLWRNTAVSLWNLGRYAEGLEAAQKAVSLDPRLEEQLAPILEWGRNAVH